MAKSSSKPKQKAAGPSLAPGEIRPDSVYTAEEARRRLRLGEWAWRQWRRDGLTVLRVSGRGFVLGADLIQFLKSRGSSTAIKASTDGEAAN